MNSNLLSEGREKISLKKGKINSYNETWGKNRFSWFNYRNKPI
jgi:hypothetical protein